MEAVFILFLIGVGVTVKSGWDHARQSRQQSGRQRVQAATRAAGRTLPKGRQQMIRRQSDIGWWASEALHGFPVMRTGQQAGWLSHKAAADHQKALREEARTTHLETRASVLSTIPEHRRRQRDALQQIHDVLGDGKGKEAVREAADAVVLPFPERPAPEPEPASAAEPGPHAPREDARPGDSSWLQPGERRCETCGGTGANADRTSNCPDCRGWGSGPADPDAPEAPPGTICTACGNPAREGDPVLQDGPHPTHRSHALDDPRNQRPSGDGWPTGQPHRRKSDNQTGGTVSDTTYSSVLQRAQAFLAQSDQDSAAIEARLNDAITDADGMQGAEVDSATLGEQMDLIDRLREAQAALTAVGEQATVVANGVQQRHSGLDEAHREAPVRAAQRDFYGEG